MGSSLFRLLPAGAAVLVALAAATARPDPPPPPDPANDPLPDGAKIRFGVTRPILRGNPTVALLPPGYTNFLAPTMAGGVRRYDLGTGRPLKKVENANELVGPGRAVASADGRRAAVSRVGTLTVVDANSGLQLLAVQPPEGIVLVGVTGASLSADGSVLAYGGRTKEGKGEVVVWDVPKNELLARFETDQAAPVYPTLSADGKVLATHGPPLAAPRITLQQPGTPPPPPPPLPPDSARTAQVWDVPNVKELCRCRVTGMGGVVAAAAFSPDADRIALSAGDGPVDLFEVKTGKRLHTLLGRKGQGVKVAISPDGRTVASVGPDYRIQRWAADGTPLGVTDPPPGNLVAPLSGLAFEDNERVAAWITVAQFCVAWEAPTGKLLTPLTDHVAAVHSIAIPKDGKDLFTAGVDTRVLRWDVATGQLNEGIHLQPARLPGQPVIRPIVNLSIDATLATWPQRAPAEVFSMETGNDIFCVPPPSVPPAATAMRVSDDGFKVIALTRPPDKGRSGACVVWDLVAQKRVAEMEIPNSAVAPLAAVAPSGNRLVVATSTRSLNTGVFGLLVTSFDLNTGKKLAEVEDPTAIGKIYLAAADETTAVLASSGGRLWPVDFEAGKVLPDIDKLPTRGEAAVYTAVVVSPDGKRIATGVVGDGLENYGVRVYDWPPGKAATHTFMGHLGPINGLRFTADGKALATGSQDTSVLLWDLTKPRPGK